MNRIYLYCNNDNRPAGGIRRIYRHADVLNDNGFEAAVIHPLGQARCSWFANRTRVEFHDVFGPAASGKAAAIRRLLRKACPASPDTAWIDPDDYLVIPEVHASELGSVRLPGKIIIFNQNAYYTFLGLGTGAGAVTSPYLDGTVTATITVSEQNRAYLSELFPGHRIARIRHGIDPAVFRSTPQKKRQIAFMTRKLPLQAEHIVNALKVRGNLRGFSLKSINGMSEAETAGTMGESMIFLSFSTLEGFGLPPAEAMSCGCFVIGYHGNAGAEYFLPEFSHPVAAEDTGGFIRAVESAIAAQTASPDAFEAKGAAAAEFIRRNYTLENEEKDIVSFWKGHTGASPWKHRQ